MSKQLIRDLLPPLLVRALRGGAESNPTFSSYAEALQQCGAGYQAEDLARVVVDKNLRLKSALASCSIKTLDFSAMRILSALSFAANASSLRILDFGGGGGTHYLIAKAVLGDRLDLLWNIVETDAMASEGKRIEDGKLKFFSDIDAAAKDLGHVDLVFSSGALQYVPNPIGFLESLLAVEATHLFITRVGLSESSQKVIVQRSRLSENGPGQLASDVQDKTLSYPATFVSKAAFESTIQKRYDIKAIFQEERNAYKAGSEPIHMYGYLASAS